MEYIHVSLSVKDARVLCDSVNTVHWLSSGRKPIGFGAFHTLHPVKIGQLTHQLLEKWNPNDDFGQEFAYRNVREEVEGQLRSKKLELEKGWNFVGAYIEANGQAMCFKVTFDYAINVLEKKENDFCKKLLSDIKEIQRMTRGVDLSDRLGIL